MRRPKASKRIAHNEVFTQNEVEKATFSGSNIMSYCYIPIFERGHIQGLLLLKYSHCNVAQKGNRYLSRIDRFLIVS